MATDSQLQAFYKNKRIFLTGGSGFLGKGIPEKVEQKKQKAAFSILIEKVLRSTDVACVYVLIRPKKGKCIEERIADIFKDPLFERLSQSKSDMAKRVKAIAGDCCKPALGISEVDRQLLCDSVHIVIHCAATVRFNEPLSKALNINTRATQDLLRLANTMKRLEAFVHVSSAFANCLDTHVDEVYYTKRLPCSALKMLNLQDSLGAVMVDNMSETLCGQFPNTYTYTKALAEEVVLAECGDLPICIFRPGIVIASYREPVAGWIDNLYGPTSILYGAAVGVLRVMYARMEADASVVPVDYCANMLLACAWDVAVNESQDRVQPPTIFNLVPDSHNTLKWIEFKRSVEQYGPKMPLTKMIWFPFLITTFSMFNYKVLCFLYHTVPGYLIDFALLLMGRKRFMIKTYQKIHLTTDLVSYFVCHNWTFGTANTQRLWQSLSPDDQQLFAFDMHAIEWPTYFYNALGGMRRFLAKEEPKSIPQGLKLMHRLEILHRTVQFLICSGGMALLWSFFKFVF